MTKKQIQQLEDLRDHLAECGAKPTDRLYHGDGETFILTGSVSVREGARLCIDAPAGKVKDFSLRVALTGYGSCGREHDKSPIAAYNALCAAPFFATTVGVAFGLVPMEVV